MTGYFRRKKIHSLSERSVEEVDYKNVEQLKEYMTESNRIIPSRITGVKAKYQRKIMKSIKIARYLGMIPYCDNHKL